MWAQAEGEGVLAVSDHKMLMISTSPGLGSRSRAQPTGLKSCAPTRPTGDRVEYWGLKLLVACLFLFSATTSLTCLVLVVRWVVNLSQWVRSL